MKINKQNNTITAAEELGTKYYRVDLEQARDALSDGDANLFLQYALDKEGWGCLDFTNNFFGSRVIDDVLYLCDTDGEYILVDGESIDPESALDEVDVSQLLDYVVPATDEYILKHITPYELKNPNMTEAAKELLSEGYTFQELFRSAQELE